MSAAMANADATHALIPLSDAAQWQAALEGVPHAFAHTWAHNQAFAQTSGLQTYLYAYARDGARAVCPLSLRSYGGEVDVFTPYGFGGFTARMTPPDLASAWHEFARAQGWVCAYLGSNPILFDPLRGEKGKPQGSIFVLDLRRSDEELLAAMSAGRRRQLRRGSDISYEAAGTEAADFLAREAPKFFAERSAASVYSLAPATWRALLEAPGTLALEARRGGALVAVTLFGLAGGIADFLFNVSTPAGQADSAGLLWEGMKRLRALGATSLNLGGGIRPGDEVAEFKRRFGAEEMPFIAYRQVFRPDVYERLCREAGVPADSTAGYFPPFHARSRS